jgi:hypothetical protein
MKNQMLVFMLLFPLFAWSQINETFSDGNLNINPVWVGDTSNFRINEQLQLQSSSKAASVSAIFTTCESFKNASWECWIKIDYATSPNNYAMMYIISDNDKITENTNGIYVQIGGSNDEVSLYLQEGNKKTKLIDGVDKRTDGKPVEISIKVISDSDMNYSLYSKLPTENEYVLEGKTQIDKINYSTYVGIVYSNTSTTGNFYFFDNIIVTGNKAFDNEAPTWTNLKITEPDKMIITFSEKMNVENAMYELIDDNNLVIKKQLSTDKKTLELQFKNEFETGTIYSLKINNAFDLAGNSLINNIRKTGISEDPEIGDLIINEIMFEQPTNSAEYVEIFNNSKKVIDVNNLTITTRKSDGNINSGNKIISENLLGPNEYLALSNTADSVRNYHNVHENARIENITLSALNNTSSTLILCNNNKDIIYDELSYNANWHHSLIKNTKGVALEKINPAMPTQLSTSWHSASSETNYGTPGYKNSQYREINSVAENDRIVWIEPATFSPNNDGNSDICMIKYQLNTNGYIGNVQVLNSIGQKIIKLGTNMVLGSEGYLIWNGINDKNKVVETGIYILYFEIFNPTNGDKKTKKIPIVVTSL